MFFLSLVFCFKYAPLATKCANPIVLSFSLAGFIRIVVHFKVERF